MFVYEELHRIRSAELIREAENHRLAREARRAARETPGTRGVPRWPYTPRPRRQRFARAA
ncbi:hypothetical protein [Streptomyces poonensis]|uniref:Uncharacterized protein n=1 Tax=Streptomyces poonensis TaxID=68255 RepID=A0A918P6H8_9ACTN|nr:hypothetical protein [Streptomyces poonensis]GGY87297.1 hypothetical protein GCM10010365_01550 [Streptomyces poonensis]GLJ90195.1 hypothetical protein GCM10017589_27980 [Streptomyces poonensis]